MRDKHLGAILDRKYRLESLVAEGGMGAVYRGRHLELDREVAVKIVRDEVLTDAVVIGRFRREARAVARLAHPYIVRCFDFGIGPRIGAYLVMEWLEGRTLKDEIVERERLDVAEAVGLAIQICEGVEEAHRAGILHRDLKPGNIFLDRQLDAVVPKILDFGLVKFLDPEISTSTILTRQGTVLGTAAYMSPEQCEAKPLDERSDLYSLGCVLYKMLAGQPPFVHRNVNKVFLKHVREQPEPPSHHRRDIPRALDEAVLRSLAKSPAERYPSVAAFADALRGTFHTRGFE